MGAFERAVEYHRGGQLSEAERLYRLVLATEPEHDRALFLLGAIALQAGRVEDALGLSEASIRIDPKNALCHANRGECLRRLGRRVEAMDAFLTALTLRPDRVEPLFNMGLLMREQGETDLAIVCFECAGELKPEMPEIEKQLAQARLERKKRTKTQRRHALPAPRPSLMAQFLAAVAGALLAQARAEAAADLCHRALELHPRSASALHNLGAALMVQGRLDEAVGSLRKALQIDPNMAVAHRNLGNAYSQRGQLDDALSSFRRSVDIEPNPAVQGNIVFTLAFHPASDPRAILEEAKRWDGTYAPLLATSVVAHRNDATPDRPLRIGYVSPDFRVHCQTLFTAPLLGHHDHARFKIFAYADVDKPDADTERLRGYVDVWRSTVGLSDAEVAAKIRDDRIDILVDLTMHMAKNRLAVFAEKPAPVQVCWLAYPGTTGVSAMDYRITDPHLDPRDSDVSVYSEQSVWLPDAFWCYDPLASSTASMASASSTASDGLDVGPLPALSRGHITLACLNNFAKVNAAVLELWSRVLREVGDARLVVMAPEGEARHTVRRAFASNGIDETRVDFVERRPRSQYLAAYRDIDVCLDTFPYNGHTTSLDALWMGVPVVTLVGRTIVGRAGYCQAKNIGVEELVAWTPEQYVQIAAGLCRDLPRLGELRASLRQRMERSPLMDAPRFARNMEEAYRTMWRRWCENRLIARPPASA